MEIFDDAKNCVHCTIYIVHFCMKAMNKPVLASLFTFWSPCKKCTTGYNSSSPSDEIFFIPFYSIILLINFVFEIVTITVCLMTTIICTIEPWHLTARVNYYMHHVLSVTSIYQLSICAYMFLFCEEVGGHVFSFDSSYSRHLGKV